MEGNRWRVQIVVHRGYPLRCTMMGGENDDGERERESLSFANVVGRFCSMKLSARILYKENRVPIESMLCVCVWHPSNSTAKSNRGSIILVDIQHMCHWGKVCQKMCVSFDQVSNLLVEATMHLEERRGHDSIIFFCQCCRMQWLLGLCRRGKRKDSTIGLICTSWLDGWAKWYRTCRAWESNLCYWDNG